MTEIILALSLLYLSAHLGIAAIIGWRMMR